MSIQGTVSSFNSYNNSALQTRIGCPAPNWTQTGQRETGGTLSNQRIDNWGGGGCWFSPPTNGFVLDRNHNGRYDRGQDSVLAFDFNRDGKLSKSEISRSNDILKAFNGDFDFNGDGKVSCSEKRRGKCLAKVAQCYDRNKDGKLDLHELGDANAKIWTDRDRDGRVDKGELGDPYATNGRGPFSRGEGVLREVGRGGYTLDNYGPQRATGWDPDIGTQSDFQPYNPWLDAGGINPWGGGGFNPWGGGGFNPWGGGGFNPWGGGGFNPWGGGGCSNPWGGGGFNPWFG